jgi:hypothetical protein
MTMTMTMVTITIEESSQVPNSHCANMIDRIGRYLMM